MTTQLNERRFTRKGALLTCAATFALLGFCGLGLDAQEKAKDKEKEKDKVAEKAASRAFMSGFTRPGNPDDVVGNDGKIKTVDFTGEFKKFKIMGGTVYFAVFKNNNDLDSGDTFGTGMSGFDSKFEAGRNFRGGVSPTFDRKANYLYLYQVVNDRNLSVRPSGEKGGIKFSVAEPKEVKDDSAIPVADDIASFALKLLGDPRDLTSFGHFRDASFAANVPDMGLDLKPLRQVVDNVEQDKMIRLAVSHLPAIQSKLSDSRFRRRAPAHSLGELEAGFGVDKSNKNMAESKGYTDLKQVADMGAKGGIKLAAFADGLVKAADAARQPEYVQIMYNAAEFQRNPLIPGSDRDPMDDEVTRVVFRVDWEKNRTLKQGERSVVFGFTTDLPPVNAPIRIDTPRGVAASDSTVRLANYFDEAVVARGVGEGSGINLVSAGADAIALASGTSLATGPTPAPGGAAAGAGGFAGMTGGMGGGLGGTTSGGGGGGMTVPGFGGGGFARPGGGQGGGLGGGQGGGQGDGGAAQDQNSAQREAQAQIVNFNATLTNQQSQQQQQGQFQGQFQNQKQNNGGRGHHHGNCPPPPGNVVPAPASLLLALLGLPGLLFLRRRKTEETSPEAVA